MSENPSEATQKHRFIRFISELPMEDLRRWADNHRTLDPEEQQIERHLICMAYGKNSQIRFVEIDKAGLAIFEKVGYLH